MQHFSRSTRTLTLLAAVLAVFAVSWIAYANRGKSAAEQQTATKAVPATSPFSFNAGEATGWRLGPSNATSIALFSKGKGCFVSLEKKSETPDESADLQNRRASQESGGYTVTETASPTAILKISDAQTEYTLHQYSVTGTGNAGELYKSQEFGYVPVSHGCVRAGLLRQS